MRQLAVRVLCSALLFVCFSASARADVITYDAGNGLSATADFQISGSTLTILLTNTSVDPFGGLDGTAAMVLSSLNFDLPTGVSIVDGNAALGAGSNAVQSTSTTAWSIYSGSYDLNDQYGFSNTGVGNTVYFNATSAITSHNNGGTSVTSFDGATGIANNGLNYGLVADGTRDIGNGRIFIQDSVLLTLTLSESLPDLSFLTSGSYVEFGSDDVFVPARSSIPEPSSLLILSVGLLGAGVKIGRNFRKTRPA